MIDSLSKNEVGKMGWLQSVWREIFNFHEPVERQEIEGVGADCFWGNASKIQQAEKLENSIDNFAMGHQNKWGFMGIQIFKDCECFHGKGCKPRGGG